LLTAAIAVQDIMVNALIHTANKDFPQLIDDLVELGVLPQDTDRGKVEPIMRYTSITKFRMHVHA
jgi:predicted unusual protein kinase regulating ubiquinone biosynthesis (AarF/ABC1/UbiB family)